MHSYLSLYSTNLGAKIQIFNPTGTVQNLCINLPRLSQILMKCLILLHCQELVKMFRNEELSNICGIEQII